MVDAAPFRGVRYDAAVAGDPATTSAPAYDDLERFAYARHRTASPYTVLELLASRGDDGYAAAGAALERWWRTGVLVRDPDPAFYRYEEHELRAGVPAVQRGILAAVKLEPLDGTGAVLAHEAVDPSRVEERLERLQAVPLDVSPVFAMYKDAPAALTAVLERPPSRPPVVAITDEDGIDHRVWALDEPRDLATIVAALTQVRVVIADGHHRYATAIAWHRRETASGRIGSDRTLMYLVDAMTHGPRVLPVHRLVTALPENVLARLRQDFLLEPAPPDPRGLSLRLDAAAGRALALRLPGPRGLLLRARDDAALTAALPDNRSASWRALDTAVLDHVVLPGLGITPDQIAARSDAVTAAAEVDAGTAAGLFMVRPVDTGTVLRLAAAGEPMPAKTTSFRPKPRTGLVMRALGE